MKILLVIDVQDPAPPEPMKPGYNVINPAVTGLSAVPVGFKRRWVEVEVPCERFTTTKVIVKE